LVWNTTDNRITSYSFYIPIGLEHYEERGRPRQSEKIGEDPGRTKKGRYKWLFSFPTKAIIIIIHH
jgi:hypothetical protein